MDMLLHHRPERTGLGRHHAKMESPPSTRAVSSMFHGRPFPCAHDREPRAVDHQMNRSAGRDPAQRDLQALTSPGQRRVVGRGEVDARQRQHGPYEPFRLAQRQPEHEPKGQGRLNCEVREPPRRPSPTRRHRPPRLDRLGRQPEGHVAAPDQRALVLRPIADVVSRFALRMHLRLHPSSIAGGGGSSDTQAVDGSVPGRLRASLCNNARAKRTSIREHGAT